MKGRMVRGHRAKGRRLKGGEREEEGEEGIQRKERRVN